MFFCSAIGDCQRSCYERVNRHAVNTNSDFESRKVSTKLFTSSFFGRSVFFINWFSFAFLGGNKVKMCRCFRVRHRNNSDNGGTVIEHSLYYFGLYLYLGRK